MSAPGSVSYRLGDLTFVSLVWLAIVAGVWDLRYADGRRDALTAFECPRGAPGDVFMRVDTRTGEVACVSPAPVMPRSRAEWRWAKAMRQRMGRVR